MMNSGDREETRALLAGARERLSRCPAGAFGAEDSAMVLGTVATLAERLIADRDERAALSLARAASRYLEFLGRHDPIAFEVRRVEAEALSELGQYQWAETKLRRLADDEQRAAALPIHGRNCYCTGRCPARTGRSGPRRGTAHWKPPEGCETGPEPRQAAAAHAVQARMGVPTARTSGGLGKRL